jgi:hypothetical protein
LLYQKKIPFNQRLRRRTTCHLIGGKVVKIRVRGVPLFLSLSYQNFQLNIQKNLLKNNKENGNILGLTPHVG